MTEPIYNHIGRVYNASRRAEPAIVGSLVELLGLPPGSVIADVGAGTGNYANALADAGFSVKAIEPSAEMRAQATPHQGATWLDGRAEDLPLPDRSVDGVVAVLAIHHFDSLPEAAIEMHRICPTGPIVIHTMDPRAGEKFWFETYFPEIYGRVFTVFLPLDQVCRTIAQGRDWTASIRKYPLPHDAVDMNMSSGWNRPEIYLDEQMRRNMSGFALAQPEDFRNGLADLRRDLESGQWDRKFGQLRQKGSLDLGYRFLRFGR
jgi:ubiquinone/menaquinone biosynthesis C-methylase UbiE